MTNWEYRRERWDAYKKGIKHGKQGFAREDGLMPERLRANYMRGYRTGILTRKK